MNSNVKDTVKVVACVYHKYMMILITLTVASCNYCLHCLDCMTGHLHNDLDCRVAH